MPLGAALRLLRLVEMCIRDSKMPLLSSIPAVRVVFSRRAYMTFAVPVSYTHLDVYKRQVLGTVLFPIGIIGLTGINLLRVLVVGVADSQ